MVQLLACLDHESYLIGGTWYTLGLLTINRLIDPGRRIEYNFLGSINRKAASPDTRTTARHRPRHAAAARGRAALPRHTDAGTRSRARTYHD